MCKMYILMNHKLTEEQMEDARKNWGITEFVYLPDNLQALFSSVPPDIDDLRSYAEPLKDFIVNNVTTNDVVLITGEFGLTYFLVTLCKLYRFKCVYATTARETIEERQSDGSVVKKSIFKHIRFRMYEGYIENPVPLF